MPFDAAKFERAKFEARREVIPLDANTDLRAFFGDGEPVQWEVRGLSARELFIADDAASKQKARNDLGKALESANGDERAAALRDALGLGHLGAATPAELAKRLELFVMGSVSPAMTLPLAIKFAEAFAIEFVQITAKIYELTGKGSAMMGKPAAASPQTTGSAQA